MKILRQGREKIHSEKTLETERRESKELQRKNESMRILEGKKRASGKAYVRKCEINGNVKGKGKKGRS